MPGRVRGREQGENSLNQYGKGHMSGSFDSPSLSCQSGAYARSGRQATNDMGHPAAEAVTVLMSEPQALKACSTPSWIRTCFARSFRNLFFSQPLKDVKLFRT